MAVVSLEFLTGKTTDQLVPYNETYLVHKDMLASLTKMVESARKDGIEIALSSSFRSFDLQKKIWNDKVMGIRPVLDSHSRPVDITQYTPEELLFLILRWSAIPGGSRHHWGSDIDVYDLATKPVDYKVQLIPEEFGAEGPFYNLNCWLDENMARFKFFRPYAIDRGGIAPEPWHLSFRPLSEMFLSHFSQDLFQLHLQESEFLLIEQARLHQEEIYQRFICIDD